jgi:hypothetical protein
LRPHRGGRYGSAGARDPNEEIVGIDESLSVEILQQIRVALVRKGADVTHGDVVCRNGRRERESGSRLDRCLAGGGDRVDRSSIGPADNDVAAPSEIGDEFDGGAVVAGDTVSADYEVDEEAVRTDSAV